MRGKTVGGSKDVESNYEITKVALFSGRFDPPTEGHVLAFLRLMLKYAAVIVVILDYKDREVKASVAKKLIDLHFDMVLPPITRSKIITVINDKHFGVITKPQLESFLKKHRLKFDTYISGNAEVLYHVRKLGYECRYLPRLPFGLEPSLLTASKIREAISDCDMSMEDFYRLEKCQTK